ncbi:MAG TPA: phenylalanine--tRNA ligase subunit alpha, partial [Anaerolineales bacterium]|nr:phenylalanine--tRNA ligase subunit alpha [Anaerolineales bacterium]
MIDQLNQFEKDALARLAGLNDSASLGVWKGETFGKQSLLSTALTALGTLPKDERPPVGRRTNEVKQALEMAYAEKEAAIRAAELERSLRAEAFDVTLPGRPVRRGRIHIANQNLRQICAIWADMGFQIYRSREVETDDYNFELLNMPQHHPARDMWDTFFTTTPGVILRTHTSPGQIHAMREYCPNPIRVVLPGMVYRYEQITAR